MKTANTLNSVNDSFEFNVEDLKSHIKMGILLKKIIVTIVFTIVTINTIAQTTFQYDAMGNRLKKEVVGNPPMAPLNNLSTALNVTLNQQLPYSLNLGYTPNHVYVWEVGNGTMVQNSSTNFCLIRWDINVQPNYVKLTLKNGACTATRTYPVTLQNAPPCASSSLTLVRPTNNISHGPVTLTVGQTISATNAITASFVSYDAGKSITLSPGFETSGAGTVFKANIKGCQ